MDARGEFSFFVHGIPKPQGSKRAFRHAKTGKVVMVESSKGLKPWREAVKFACLEKIPADLNMQHDWAWTMAIRFYLPRPKSHYGKKGLRPSAPVWPITVPDLDKLVRGVMDALTGILWRSDSQVVRWPNVEKVYAGAKPPGAFIVVAWMPNRREK